MDDQKSNFASKKQLIDKAKEASGGISDLDDAGGQMLKLLSDDIPKYLRNTFKAVRKGVIPDFYVRFQNKKIHAKLVEDKEQ